MLEPEIRDVVVHATGRDVLAVLNATGFDPDLSAEVFVLAPAGAPPAEDDPFTGARTAIERSHAEKQDSAALRAESRQAVRHSAERRAGRTGGDTP